MYYVTSALGEMTSQPKLEETQRLWDEAAASFDDEPDHGLRDPHVRQAWSDLLVNSLPSPLPTFLTSAVVRGR